MRLLVAAIALGVVVPLAAVVPSGSALAAAGCTKTGTPGADQLVGTRRRDVLCGLGGNDVLVGRGGDDVLIGGGGKDTLIGGSGDDRLQGSKGFDIVSYRDHRGAVVARLESGTGSSRGLHTTSYREQGAPMVARLEPGTGGSKGEQDQLSTVEGLTGGDGNDTLVGDAGRNTLTGGAGDDVLTGQSGEDVLSGGPQDDVLLGGEGIDDLDGGGGVNTCDSSPGEAVETSCRYDVSGPDIVSMTTNKPSYQPGDEFVLDLHVVDPSGADLVGAYFMIDRQQNDFCGQFARRISGTQRDGVWRLRCTLPMTARNGSYEGTPYARDIMGNWTNTNNGTADDTRALFTITGASDDATGPAIRSVELGAPGYTPGASMSVTVAASDPSGINHLSLTFVTGGRGYPVCDDVGHPQLTSGTMYDGTWSLSCDLPEHLRNGDWAVYASARDAVNNWTYGQNGDPGQVTGSFAVTGGTDDAVGPTVVEVTTNATSYVPGDELVLQLRLTDETGVDTAGAMFDRDGHQNDFCGQPLTFVSGTAKDGIWELRCRVPSTAPVGHYTVTPYGRDLVGNYVNVNGHETSPLRAEFDIAA